MVKLSETEFSAVIKRPSSTVICHSFGCREKLDSLNLSKANIIVTYNNFKTESVLIQNPSEVEAFKEKKVIKSIIEITWLAIDEILKVRDCPFCKEEVYTRGNPVIVCPSCKGRFS